MSGPKVSRYYLEQRRLKELRRQNRISQQDKIRAEIKELTEKAARLEKEYGAAAKVSAENCRDWIKEAQNHIDGDLRLAWRGINGVKNYLRKKQVQFKNREEAAAERERKREMAVKEEGKINKITAELEALAEMDFAKNNQGILQRVELFKNAYLANPKNMDTLRQIEDFFKQADKLAEEYEEKKMRRDYVKKAFINAIGGSEEDGDDGSVIIKGSLDGAEVEVALKENDEIRFEMPDDGSCKNGIQTISDSLASSGIELGPIFVVKTGQTINSKNRNIDTGNKTLA